MASVQRCDHVGVIVEDLDAVAAFFVDLGLERLGEPQMVEGHWVDRIVGLEGMRVEVLFVQAPDGSGRLELIRFHAPDDGERPDPETPPNRLGMRHIAFIVDDVDALVERLRGNGSELVGEIQDYGDVFRLCYLRGPEGLIIELAQRIG